MRQLAWRLWAPRGSGGAAQANCAHASNPMLRAAIAARGIVARRTQLFFVFFGPLVWSDRPIRGVRAFGVRRTAATSLIRTSNALTPSFTRNPGLAKLRSQCRVAEKRRKRAVGPMRQLAWRLWAPRGSGGAAQANRAHTSNPKLRAAIAARGIAVRRTQLFFVFFGPLVWSDRPIRGVRAFGVRRTAATSLIRTSNALTPFSARP
jgi:hypothetical protein